MEAIVTSTRLRTSRFYRVAAGFLVGVALAVVGATMSAAQATQAAAAQGPGETTSAGCERLAALALPHA